MVSVSPHLRLAMQMAQSELKNLKCPKTAPPRDLWRSLAAIARPEDSSEVAQRMAAVDCWMRSTARRPMEHDAAGTQRSPSRAAARNARPSVVDAGDSRTLRAAALTPQHAPRTSHPTCGL
jgi:hypothetical protein